jgi:hypothetical protein
MKTLCRLAACFVSLAALSAPAICEPVPGISAPVAYDNLAVYFVRGNGGGAAPLTLDQAVNSGQAEVRWHSGDPITVENFSDQSVFVPFGTLLKGGLQDQVTSVSLLLPPHSGAVSLATFCVDPFRSTARDQESPNTMSTAGQMFPGHLAALAMLVSAPKASTVTRLRQSAVWWSIDTLRSQLSRNIGVTVESPHEYHWALTDLQDQVSNVVLGARTSPWTTSLPLALENVPLLNAQQAYVDALAAAAAGSDDIVGAVFAVNGNLVGAEIYQSHALFDVMWPKLLRANAIEALAANHDPLQAPPSVEAVNGFLASALAGTARKLASGPALRDSTAAIVAETKAPDGNWINLSVVARSFPAAAAASPEAVLLGILTSGRVNGQSLESLGDRDVVVLHHDAPGRGWSTTIQDSAPWLQFDLGSKLAPAAISFAFFTLLFWLLMPRRPRRRDAFVHARLGAGHVALQRRPDFERFEPALNMPVPVPPPLASMALAAKAFVVLVAALLERARNAVRRLRAALAGFPPPRLAADIARHLGPAWPGNFRAPERAMRWRK